MKDEPLAQQWFRQAAGKDSAAHTVGIAPKTLLRWIKEPEFDADYRAARARRFPNRPRACSRLRAPPPRAAECVLNQATGLRG